jgi:uncharacterized membrane protein YqgA involved in biofilm formation
VAGTGIGLSARGHLPEQYHEIALAAVGLGTVGLGLKMFISSRNALIPIGALIFGGLLGHLLGIQAGIEALGSWAKTTFGEGGRIEDAFVTTSILFCVGPMTLLGCLEDGLEGKLHLLGIKSILDGISSVFFAAALGWGVLLSAATVLLVQGSLTLGARQLRPLLSRRDVLDETTAAGGGILIAIGIGLLGLRSLPSADFLPALVLAGAAAWWFAPRELEQVTPGPPLDE